MIVPYACENKNQWIFYREIAEHLGFLQEWYLHPEGFRCLVIFDLTNKQLQVKSISPTAKFENFSFWKQDSSWGYTYNYGMNSPERISVKSFPTRRQILTDLTSVSILES